MNAVGGQILVSPDSSDTCKMETKRSGVSSPRRRFCIRLHSKIQSEIGTWPNGSLYDKTAGWRFRKLYSRQTMLAGLLGEIPFGEFLAAGDHGVGVLVELQVMCPHNGQSTLPYHALRHGYKHMCF